MTTTEPTETEELGGRLLELIDAYRMRGALDPRDLYPKAAPDVTRPAVAFRGEGYVRDGVYHLATVPSPSRERDASLRRSSDRRARAA